MRIAIDSSVSGNEKWFPILDIICIHIDERRHTFDAAAALDLLSSPWISDRPFDLADSIRLNAVANSTDPDADASLVILDANCPRGGRSDFDRSRTTLHPIDAIMFLATPFQVILENEVFDGAFLLWMAKALNYTKFIDSYRAGRFVFRHAGGKDSIQRSAMAFLSGVWPRKDERYTRGLRMWLCAVLDNDSRHANEEPNRQIVTDTTPYVTFVHQLKKRSIEAYIPVDFLHKLGPKIVAKRKIYALNRLNGEQRKYYHMKKGFRFEKNEAPTKAQYNQSTKITNDEKALFESVPVPDWQELRAGFGGALSTVFVDKAFRPNANDVRVTDAEDKMEILSLLKRIYERI